MPKFSQDWFKDAVPIFEEVLEMYKGRDGVHYLEIGSFEGRSVVWMLENILTGEDSDATCIDSFGGGKFYKLGGNVSRKLENTLHSNLKPFKGKYRVLKGESQDVLKNTPMKEQFDIIYVDGFHSAPATLQDILNSFYALKMGGIMLIDDHTWAFNGLELQETPKIAIDSFINCFKDKIELIYLGWKTVAIKKLN